MTEIRTLSGRHYTYDPLSNRIHAGRGSDVSPEPLAYRLSEELDFSGIGMLTIEMTQQCNLRCSYCCYSGAYPYHRSHQSLEISGEGLARAVDYFAPHCRRERTLPVCFYGGESLLCMGKIKEAIAMLRERLPGREFEFSLSSNGLLLTEETARWVAETPDVVINITIDGDKTMHDKNRLTRGGEGSWDIIIRNLEHFNVSYPGLFNSKIRLLSTVGSIADLIPLNDFWMSHPLLKGNRPVHIACILPNFARGERVEADSKVFTEVYDRALRHFKEGPEDILTDELHNLVKPFTARSYRELRGEIEFETCLNRPESLFVTADGKILVCERLGHALSIGSLAEGISPSRVREINERYVTLKNKYCGSCWARRLCRRCLVSLNTGEDAFLQYCESERMQLRLALRYYCEMLEHRHLR